MKIRLVFPLLLAASSHGLAQADLTCIMNAGVPPTVRSSGKTEMTGDVTIQCMGGTPTPAGSPIPKYTLRVRTQGAIVQVDPNYNVTGFQYYPANITSRALANDGSSEALITIDEPHSPTNPSVPLLVCGDTAAPASAGACSINGAASPAGVYDGSAGRPNVFQGKQIAPDTLEWANIPFDAPGPNFSRILRLTNIRANASQVSLSSNLLPAQIVSFITLTSPSGANPLGNTAGPYSPANAVTVANVQPEVIVTSSSLIVPAELQQCQASNAFLLTNPASGPATSTAWVRVREGFQSAFKRKNWATAGVNATTYPAGGDQNQNVPGAVYNTESGFENLGPARDPNPNPPYSYQQINLPPSAAFPASLASAGTADQGYRTALIFNPVTPGVSLFVPTSIQLINQISGRPSGGQAVLVSTDFSGAGAFSPVPSNGGSIGDYASTTAGLAQVPLTGGIGIAVYEILNPDSLSPEQFIVPIAAAYQGGAPALNTTSLVSVTSAPFSGSDLADSQSLIPRFASSSVAGASSLPLFTFSSCDAPRLTLTSSATLANQYELVNFVATVTPNRVWPSSGRLDFYVDSTRLASGPLAADGTFRISFTPNYGNGLHGIAAVYTAPAPDNIALSDSIAILVAPWTIQPKTGTVSQIIPVGTSAQLPVIVKDGVGNAKPGASVTFALDSVGAANARFSNGLSTITLVTDSTGTATATLAATAGFASFAVNVTANPGDSSTPFSITVPTPPQSTGVGTNFPNPLIFIAKDSNGRPVPNAAVTFTAPSNGPSILGFSQFTLTTGSDGTVSYIATANNIPGGPYTVTASGQGLLTMTFMLTNTALAPAVVIWANPADILYGSALGSGQLNATASIAGTFTYTPASGTVLPVGDAQTLSVIFTPANSALSPVTKTVLINVKPAAVNSTPANIAVTTKLARDVNTNEIVVSVILANTGGLSAPNVSVLTATLGGISTTTVLPVNAGTIAGGAQATTTLRFPASTGASGARSILNITGAFTGGGTFGGSTRVTLP